MFPCHELSAFQKSLQRHVLIILARVRASFPAAILVAKGEDGIRAHCVQFVFHISSAQSRPQAPATFG